MTAYATLAADDVTQWSAGVDWLTCTWRDDSEEGAYAVVRDLARQAAHDCNDGSLSPEYATVQGYKGTRVGRTFVGLLKGQGVLLAASGAASHWLVSVEGLQPDNVSRIDVQVTVWGESDVGHIPKQVAAKSHAARFGAMGRPWKVRLEDGWGDGDTAYLGSRSSDVYCRCYDKGRESGEAYYKKAIRYEVEFKRQWAVRCHSHLVGGNGGRFAAYDTVARTYERRGVALPAIRPLGAPMEPPREDVADEIERKLKWYQEQVAPSVARLLTMGVPRSRILESLGLY